jgi:hypothetical protein
LLDAACVILFLEGRGGRGGVAIAISAVKKQLIVVTSAMVLDFSM